MATGYRLVNADDYSPRSPFADGVTTAPGSVSDANGFWIVDPGLRRLGLTAYFSCMIVDPDDTTDGVLLQVDYDEADIVDTIDNLGPRESAHPNYKGLKILAGTASVLYTKSGEFSAASQAAEP